MYTEEDLRATLGALEHEAPAPGRVLAGLDRARRRRVVRRRTTGMVAAAVLGVVVAGGSIVVTNRADPPADRPGPVVVDPQSERRLQFPFAVEEIPGYQLAYRSLGFESPSQVWVGVDLTDPAKYEDVYTLAVYRKGQYDPADAAGGEPVQVRGKPGSYHTAMACSCSYTDPDSAWPEVPGVAWEYAPDSWALVQYHGKGPEGRLPADLREMSLRIADAVRFDRTAPVRVPFRLGYLPAGVEPAPEAIVVNSVYQGSLAARLDYVDGDRHLTIDANTALGEQYSTGQPIGEPVVIDYADSGLPPSVLIVLGQIGVQVSGVGFSVDELKKIASSATAVGDVYDLASWFDAVEAIPLR
jgi:hypothetical protein